MLRKIALTIIVVLFFYLCVHAENTKTKGLDALSWVGVVYSNGILTPAFQVDADGTWTKCWPEPVNGKQKLMADKTIKDIPKEWLGKFPEFPEKWRMLPDAPGKNVLSVLKAHKYEERCTEEWGIITDFSSATKTASLIESHSVVTVAGDLKMEAPVYITYTSKEHPKLAVFLRKEFDRMEDDYVSDYIDKNELRSYYSDKLKNENLTHIPDDVPISKELRKKNPVSVTRIVKVANLFYFECNRTYQLVPGNRFPGKGFINGWVYKKENGQYTTLESVFICSDSPVKGPYGYAILGYCTLNKKTYILAARDYYESSDYVVLEVLKDGLKEVIKIEGSGC